MPLREKINENQTLVVIVTAVVIVAALLYLFFGRGGGPDSPSNQMWYEYADSTERFAADADHLSPAQFDGRTAYMLNLYACGPCQEAEPDQMIPVYIKYSDEALARIREAGDVGLAMQEFEAVQQGMLRSLDKQTWHGFDDAMVIDQKLDEACPDGVRLNRCPPD